MVRGGIKHGYAGLQFNEFIPSGDLAGKDSAEIIHAEIQAFLPLADIW